MDMDGITKFIKKAGLGGSDDWFHWHGYSGGSNIQYGGTKSSEWDCCCCGRGSNHSPNGHLCFAAGGCRCGGDVVGVV